jgi:hypothetical protein
VSIRTGKEKVTLIKTEVLENKTEGVGQNAMFKQNIESHNVEQDKS